MNTVKDNTQRAKNVIIAFAALALIDILSILLGLYQNKVLEGYNIGNYTEQDIDQLDTYVAYLAIIQTATIIVLIVIFIMWFRRAYENLIALDVKMNLSGNGAVWGFFIPFLNWVRPIQTVKEIFIKTQNTLKNYNESTIVNTNTSFIVAWWIVYLINGAISNVASRSIEKADTIEKYIDANYIYIFSDSWDLLAIGLAIIVVNTISKLEVKLKNTDTSTSLIDQIGSRENQY
ncbi:DUF4328 domain-containing protein [Lacinutrix salivirga]